MLPCITMGLRIFVTAERATLLVDTRSPRSGSKLSIPIHLPALAALMSTDVGRNL